MRRWFRGCLQTEKGPRFERFMAWYMMYVYDEKSNQMRNRGAFRNVTVNGGPGDGGRDIVCTSWDESKVVVLNCKNERVRRGPDLLHTVASKLQNSEGTQIEYHEAIAAQHPRFTANVMDIANELNDKLFEISKRVIVLEWESRDDRDGIKARLERALIANPLLPNALDDRLLDDFALCADGQPKSYDYKSHRGRLRAAHHI